jgi:hypothetical protein
MAGINDLASSILQSSGQGNFYSEGNKSTRSIYPAIVVSIDDPLSQNRIKARIVSLDENGDIVGGKDRDVPDSNLVYCIPLMPEFFHVRPLVDEMVFVMLENPTDISAPRFWIGPIITSQLKLKYQSYKEAVKVFEYSSFNVNPAMNDKFKASAALPEHADVAMQGRDDADLILKPREAFLSAGKFKNGTIEVNTESPSNIQLKQFDDNKIGPLKTFSQANIQSTNINIYSPLGKFRAKDLERFETNPNLKSFGDTASKLHPVVFGDELIKLLDVMIRVIMTHIHTPQSPPTPTPDIATLQMYSISGQLQDLISNHVRVN